jgi:hypothetical protein
MRPIWSSSRALLAWGGLLFLLAAPPSRGAPPPVETREFTILVDNAIAGSYALTIAAQPDGSTTVTSRGHVVVPALLLFKYEYSYEGTETWKGGGMQRAQCTANDDGKKTQVAAVCQGQTCQISVNGKSRSAAIPAWTSSYTTLPAPDVRGQEMNVLDVDTGALVRAKLQFVEKTQLNLGGASRACSHYRVTGGLQADLWFDDQDRLVRQLAKEEGHLTEWRLSGLRPAPR